MRGPRTAGSATRWLNCNRRHRPFALPESDTAALASRRANSLKPRVVAEGVAATEDQAQGFLYSKPVPADELARMLPALARPSGRAGEEPAHPPVR